MMRESGRQRSELLKREEQAGGLGEAAGCGGGRCFLCSRAKSFFARLLLSESEVTRKEVVEN